MAQLQWIRLNREQAQRVLKQLSTHRDAVVFSREVTDVSWLELPFYTNYRLYRLVNYATLPTFTMTYLSDGSEYIALDGTANPIYTVNEKDPLQLTEDNVIGYLVFFFGNVQGSEGDVFLIKNPDKMPFMSSLTPAQKQNIDRSFRMLEVIPDPANHCFIVNATLHYGGGLVAAEIVIMDDGKISFQDQNLLITGIHFPHSPHTQGWLESIG